MQFVQKMHPFSRRFRGFVELIYPGTRMGGKDPKLTEDGFEMS